MNKSIIGIDHPAVAAVDPTRLADWYEDVLGYEKFHHTEKNVWIMRAKDGTLLEIMPKDETNRPNRTCWTPGWSHLALRVNDLERRRRNSASMASNWRTPCPPSAAACCGRSTIPKGTCCRLCRELKAES